MTYCYILHKWYCSMYESGFSLMLFYSFDTATGPAVQIHITVYLQRPTDKMFFMFLSFFIFRILFIKLLPISKLIPNSDWPINQHRQQLYCHSRRSSEMGRRKKANKPPPKRKAIEPLDTQFTCPFCNHEKACEVKLWVLWSYRTIQKED